MTVVPASENFMIRNNVITRTAVEYMNQVGIGVYYEANINILHNTGILLYCMPLNAVRMRSFNIPK